MSKVYLINVGANMAHKSIARSPIRKDGSFVFVTYPDPDSEEPYPKEMQPFVRDCKNHCTHLDPDWGNLTYGDDCNNKRAEALLKVVEDDILLFWGLLWKENGEDRKNWHEGWYLVGALRVREILEEGQGPEAASNSARFERAQHNAHFDHGKLDQKNRVFIGCTKYSKLFRKAVDLEVRKKNGLLYRTVRTARGGTLTPKGKSAWYSSLRPCRPVWNLTDSKDRALAQIVGDRVRETTGYDFLSGLGTAATGG